MPQKHPFQVTYAIGREFWVSFLNKIELHKYKILEMDFESIIENNNIAGKLSSAVQSLNEGGSEKWKSSINSIREIFQHLEAQNVLPKENPGNFGSNDLTKEERIKNVGWVLKKFCHLASHPKENKWSRDDALLAICGLALVMSSIKKD